MMITLMPVRTVWQEGVLHDGEEELGAEEAEGGEADCQAGEQGPHLGEEGKLYGFSLKRIGGRCGEFG